MCPSYRAHARGALLDARPRAPARRDAARRGHHRRLGQHRSAGSARLVPRLQGLPQRLPDAYRHGGLQGRVPVAPLRVPPPPAPGLVDGPHRRMGAARFAGFPGVTNLLSGLESAKRLAGFAPERSCRDSPRTPSARNSNRAAAATASFSSTTRSTTTSGRGRRQRRRSCSRWRAAPSSCRRGTCAAAGRTTTTACWTRRSVRSCAS